MARKALYSVGTMRLTREEISKLVKDDLKAISAFLGNKQYIMGNKISSVDAVVYGFITLFVDSSFPLDDSEFAKSLKNIVEYQKRIKKEYFIIS